MTNVKDIEKLKEYTAQIDAMIAKRINPSSEDFISWRTKTERLLGRIFGEGSQEHKRFKDTSFSSLMYIGGMSDAEVIASDVESCMDSLKSVRPKLQVYIEELKEAAQEETVEDDTGEVVQLDFSKVFIVHGHDGELKTNVARILERQGIEAVILHEKANIGRTIIEKIEAESMNVAAAICLFTADDVVSDGSKRARQNVLFETGYFYGRIGRGNTIIVAEDETMNLSDLSGVVYVNKNNWEVDVLKELRAIGYQIDMNRL